MGKRKSYEAQMEEYQLYQNITSIPTLQDVEIYLIIYGFYFIIYFKINIYLK